MPDTALTPFIHHDQWNRMNSDEATYDSGGWRMPPEGGGDDLHFWYLHYPAEGPTLTLWNNNPEQSPEPTPDPPENFVMEPDEWVKVAGGRLLDNRNWIAKTHRDGTAELFEIVSVEMGRERKVMAVKIG